MSQPPPGYQPQSNETSIADDLRYFEHLARLTPWQKLQLAGRASMALVQFQLAGLRSQFPDADETEIEQRAAARRIGPRLARLAFGARAEELLG